MTPSTQALRPLYLFLVLVLPLLSLLSALRFAKVPTDFSMATSANADSPTLTRNLVGSPISTTVSPSSSSLSLCVYSSAKLGIYVVPALPILVDPRYFLWFHDPQEINPKDPNIVRYRHFANARFAYLSLCGDGELHAHCIRLAHEMLGTDNRYLANTILNHVESNETWRQLAIAYRLDIYVGSLPFGLSFKERINTKTDKFWADIWEAYWGGLFLERELWNESVDDLTSYLRSLLYLRYQPLINVYSTNPLINIGTNVQQSKLRVTEKDIDVQEIVNDPLINKCLEGKVDNGRPYGYLATLKQSRPNESESMFALTRDDAISKFVRYKNSSAGYSQHNAC